MKQVIQHHRSGTVNVDDIPPPALRGAGLLVLNEGSLVSHGTEKFTMQVAHKSLIGKGSGLEKSKP